MIRTGLHRLLLLLALLLTGCVLEPVPSREAGPGFELTVRCDDVDATKAAPADGEVRFNENLIRSVDFFFYPGTNPDRSADAVHHIRKDLEDDPVSYAGGQWEATFRLVVTKVQADAIFLPGNDYKATVYAVVNYDGALVSGESLSGTSLDALAAVSVETDFAATEHAYLQPAFLMDGKAVIQFHEDQTPSVTGTVDVRRFAAKLTTSVSVAPSVILKHSDLADTYDEKWTPVLHTMRIYLVDGAKTVSLGTGTSADNADPGRFSYSDNTRKRPFVKEDGTALMAPDVVTVGSEERTYYNTYPMYSYPVAWESTAPDYSQSLPAQPYLKLEMDWRREEYNGYSYDRRKYYYKIYLPFNSLERNNWYHFNIDVSILGTETDEGKAILTPTFYVLDWQNKSLAINKYAVISKARYLSVDERPHILNNLTTLSIPFLSSHDVKIVPGTERATRPYYGEIASASEVGQYNERFHGYIRQSADGKYYLDFKDQPAGKEAYEPANWLTNTSTSIVFNHGLRDYGDNDFDYSPYTIEFDIVHDDLTEGYSPYNEYLKHITIIQYPGIYIEATRNSDTKIKKKGSVYGYDEGTKPWLNMPWGYVYIDNGRFIRTGDAATEPYNALSTDNNKREYQWRTVWYTGGDRDLFKINVTVLPEDSDYVIGDPRTDDYDRTNPVLGYSFVNNGNKPGDAVLPDRTGNPSNFTAGPVVDGDISKPLAKTGEERPLTYYYPTDPSPRTERMLAPSYRISTKLGGTEFGNLKEEYAKYRCAGYQEDGFPGGRWRLPTLGEIQFIAGLSASGVFEVLFNTGGSYWSANGVVKVNSNGTVTKSGGTEALLRCVYDSWYWGDEQWNPRTEFVWGDREK